MDIKQIINVKDITNIKKYNYKTILSILLVLAGILFYIYWGISYGVWVDIGIYSVTIVFVLGGILGFILSFLEGEQKE